MNQLTTTRAKLPAIPQVDFRLGADLKSLACWTPDNPLLPVELTRALTVDERKRIETRLAEIGWYLDQRDAEQSRRTVAGMMLSIPSGRASGEEAAAIIAAYVNALADLPSWAVSLAANRFIRGQVKTANPAFPPSGAEVHLEAEKELVPLRAEKIKLERMLSAVVPNRVIPPNSRIRQSVIDEKAKAALATKTLAAKAAELGVPLSEIPSAKPNEESFAPLSGKAVR